MKHIVLGKDEFTMELFYKEKDKRKTDQWDHLALLKLSFYIIKGKSQYDEDKVGIVWNLYKIKNYGRYFGIFSIKYWVQVS